MMKPSLLQNTVPTNTSHTSKESSFQNESKAKIESEKNYGTPSHDVPMLLNGDNSLKSAEVDLLNNEKEKTNNETKEDNDIPMIPVNDELEIKPLTDISVTLENIKPGIQNNIFVSVSSEDNKF